MSWGSSNKITHVKFYRTWQDGSDFDDDNDDDDDDENDEDGLFSSTLSQSKHSELDSIMDITDKQ